MASKRTLASTIYRRYYRIIDEINANGAAVAWMRNNREKVPVFTTRTDFWHYVNQVVGPESQIDYLEFGVYRGDSLRQWTKFNTNPDSRFFGFDSFEGLPAAWNKTYQAGHFNLDGVLPEIGDDRAALIKGWFQKTLRLFLRDFRPQGRLIIHNDSDLHSSTLFVLTVLDLVISAGTVIMFDEFATNPLHEFRAFDEYVAAFMRDAQLLCMTTERHASRAAFVFR